MYTFSEIMATLNLENEATSSIKIQQVLSNLAI